ncbi:MAG TPA: hypothetical protein DCS93_17010 [Microscillaceae bacterium]|nr:hypothetical protein [Microscillaceae bacterium]
MYKLFTLIFISIISLSVQAQDFKGRRVVGLDLNLSQNDTKGGTGFFSSGFVAPQKGNQLSISPNLSYFVSNRWLLGGSLDFQQSRFTVYPDNPGSQQTNNVRSIGGSIFAAYHHWFSNKVAFFMRPSLGYSRANFEHESQNVHQKGNTNSFFMDASLGLTVIIRKRFGIDFSTPLSRLEYSQTSSTSEFTNGDPTQSFDNREWSYRFLGGNVLSILSNVSIGLKYFF